MPSTAPSHGWLYEIEWSDDKDTLMAGEVASGISQVEVIANDESEASLLAQQMVASQGREPTRSTLLSSWLLDIGPDGRVRNGKLAAAPLIRVDPATIPSKEDWASVPIGGTVPARSASGSKMHLWTVERQFISPEDVAERGLHPCIVGRPVCTPNKPSAQARYPSIHQGTLAGFWCGKCAPEGAEVLASRTATVQHLPVDQFIRRFDPMNYESWDQAFQMLSFDLEDHASYRGEGDDGHARMVDYPALIEDVRQHGFKHPVQVLNGRVVQGHHRVAIARMLGLPVPFEDLRESGSEIRWAKRHRRPRAGESIREWTLRMIQERHDAMYRDLFNWERATGIDFDFKSTTATRDKLDWIPADERCLACGHPYLSHRPTCQFKGCECTGQVSAHGSRMAGSPDLDTYRSCDRCGYRFPAHVPRRRDGDDLVCDNCHGKTAATTTAATVSNFAWPDGATVTDDDALRLGQERLGITPETIRNAMPNKFDRERLFRHITDRVLYPMYEAGELTFPHNITYGPGATSGPDWTPGGPTFGRNDPEWLDAWDGLKAATKTAATGQWYHASLSALPLGTVLVGGGEGGTKANFPEAYQGGPSSWHPDYVWMFDGFGWAKQWLDSFWEGQPTRFIYRVEPMAEVQNFAGAVYYTERARVVEVAYQQGRDGMSVRQDWPLVAKQADGPISWGPDPDDWRLPPGSGISTTAAASQADWEAKAISVARRLDGDVFILGYGWIKNGELKPFDWDFKKNQERMPLIDELARDGRPCEGPRAFHQMESNACYDNVVSLLKAWGGSDDLDAVYREVYMAMGGEGYDSIPEFARAMQSRANNGLAGWTGWAKNGGEWRPHAWATCGVNYGGVIVETTVPRDAYWGVPSDYWLLHGSYDMVTAAGLADAKTPEEVANALGASYYPANSTFDDRIGKCYEMAARWVCDHPSAKLVHGSIEGMGKPRISHAWAESGGRVFDAVMGEWFDADVHRSMFNAIPEHTYTRAQVLDHVLESGNWGPWETMKYAILRSRS